MKKLLLYTFITSILHSNSFGQQTLNSNSGISPIDAYTKLIQSLDPNFPGRGMDVFNREVKDRPMAYALILSAETNRYKYQKDKETLHLIRTCGNWLLNNSDINSNGIHGYGLADDWDAFYDGTINPAHSEYTITTGLVINGLLDWYTIEGNSKVKSNIYSIILKLITPFISTTYDTELGLVPYSLNANDRNKDVFNPAVYLAGQFQRFSKITANSSVKKKVLNKAKHIINRLSENQKIDLKGNTYWNYGVRITVPNDLVHTCYILEGMRAFKTYEGETDLEWKKMFNHLLIYKYYGRWYERLGKRYQKRERNSRLWALGMLMYSLAKENLYLEINASLWPQIQEYYLGNGRFKFTERNTRKAVRQEAHLLLGLSYYIFNEKNFPKQ